ncbi:MAG: hypothetical protein WBB28_19755 [Crinalium sp.]
MIGTNVYLDDEVKKLLIKAAAIKGKSIESLASEILNTAIREQCSVVRENIVARGNSKPALAGTEPFYFLATPEESGIPADEWEMENDNS